MTPKGSLAFRIAGLYQDCGRESGEILFLDGGLYTFASFFGL